VRAIEEAAVAVAVESAASAVAAFAEMSLIAGEVSAGEVGSLGKAWPWAGPEQAKLTQAAPVRARAGVHGSEHFLAKLSAAYSPLALEPAAKVVASALALEMA